MQHRDKVFSRGFRNWGGKPRNLWTLDVVCRNERELQDFVGLSREMPRCGSVRCRLQVSGCLGNRDEGQESVGDWTLRIFVFEFQGFGMGTRRFSLRG